MNRREAEELLPWYVAGTLSEQESQAVQAFIDSGEIQQRDLDELALFAETVQEQSADEPAYNPQLLNNVMAQLDSVEQAAPDEPLVVQEPARSESWLSALMSKFQWAMTPPLAKVAIGAQFVLVLAMGAVLISNTDQGTGYDTVSGPGITAQADLTLAIADGVTEAQMRELLLDADITIVAGPTALGMYSVAIAPDADAQAVSQTLADSGLIRFVQPAARP